MTASERQEPLVDIGIPTRGRSRYLADAVESVLAQTESRWRLVVSENDVGDGQVASALGPYLEDDRIRHSATGRDLGAAGNHTRLLELVRAPFTSILHDDDTWEPEFLSRRLEFLERHPSCGLVFSPTRVIDSAGREKSRSAATLTEGVHEPESFLPLLYGANVIGVPSNVLGRSGALRAVGAHFDERFLYWDWEIWFRTAARYPVGYLHSWDASIRTHDERVTMTVRPDREEILRLFDHFEEIARRDLPDLELSRFERGRKRSTVLLSGALDHVERGERRHSLECVARALRAHPPAVLNTKTLAWLVAFPFGARSERILARTRRTVLRRSLRVHLRR